MAFGDGNDGGSDSDFAGGEVDTNSAGMDMDAGGVGPSDAGDLGAQEAPDAPAWTPPTREAYEAMQKHAELGQRYGPYQQQIDQALKAGLTPQQAQQVVAQGRKEGVGTKASRFKTFAAYAKWMKDSESDPEAFGEGIDERFDARYAPHGEKMTALEKRVEEMSQQLAEARGALIVAPHQFQVNKEFEKHREAAMKLATQHRIPFAQAMRFAQQEAELTQLRAAAKAQQGGGTQPLAPARRVAGAPKEDRSLHPSRAPGGQGVGAAPFVPSAAGKGSKFSQSIRHVAKNRLSGKR